MSWTPERRPPDELGREFFAAIDARDPRRLRATLANHASFGPSAPELIRPADEIVAYFGTVVSSYPTARWEVTDVISDGERAAVQFTLREFAPTWAVSSSPSKWRSCAQMRGRSPASSAITTRASFASSSGATVPHDRTGIDMPLDQP